MQAMSSASRSTGSSTLETKESRESMTLPKNLQVARQAKLEPLGEVAAQIGIGEHLLEPYGEGVAKIKLEAIGELSDRPKARYVVVSAITPTPLGEGKTTTTVG